MKHLYHLGLLIILGGLLVYAERTFISPKKVIPGSCHDLMRKRDYLKAQASCLRSEASDEEILDGVVALIKTGSNSQALKYLSKLKSTSQKDVLDRVKFWSVLAEHLQKNKKEAALMSEVRFE